MADKKLAKEIERARKWKSDSILWVKDMFADNIKKEFLNYSGKASFTETGLTVQQELALRELSKLINAKMKVYKGSEMTEEESEYAGKIGMSIMSGTGTGKDFFLALVMCYFLTVFKDPRVTATANSAKQLRNVLWSQIARVMALSKKIPTEHGEMPILEYLLECQSEKVFLKSYKGKSWFAEGVTCSVTQTVEEQAEVLGGRHSKYMLLAADEATGIPDGVFKPLEGTLTGAVNILFLIFNPTRTKGFAIDSQYKDKGRWVALRWNSEESEIVTKESIESLARKYGKDSAPYRIRVLGLPPAAETDAFIPWDWIEDAIDKKIEPADDDPVIKALDCGAGGDKSVITTRKAGKVDSIRRNSTADSMQLVGWAANDLEDDDADVMIVDKKGIGYAVFGRLQELKGWRIRAYDGSRSAVQDDRFNNTRDECYNRLRDQFEQGLMSIPNDPDLIDQLGALKGRYDSSGQLHIERKEDLKKRTGHSPDEADSLVMTYFVKDATFRKNKADNNPYTSKETENEHKDHSWMAA